MQIEFLHLRVGNLDLRSVGVGIQPCVDPQSRLGTGFGNEIDYGGSVEERFASPVL